MLVEYIKLLKYIEWTNLLDIVIATILIWFGIHALLNMKSRIVVMGLVFYALLISLANQIGLKLTFWLIQGAAAVVILAVIVAYQKEIRRIIERFSGLILKRNRTLPTESSILADLLADTLQVLSSNHRGAIIVVAGSQPLQGHLAGGINLNGKLSKALLLSIFDPNSPGHDGAVIIRDGQVESFGCRLPLSDQDEQLAEKGTRHAAALGLSEVTDTMVLIVSEETGKISIAEGGQLLKEITLDFLKRKILSFYGERSTNDGSGKRFSCRLWEAISRHRIESFFAPLIAFILWILLVPGAALQTATYEIPVEVQNIPEGYTLHEINPQKVAVTLAGAKRSFFYLKPDSLVIKLDGTLAGFGRQIYPVTRSYLHLPPDIEISGLTPEQVKVSVRKLP